MLGGLPEETAKGIVEGVIFNLALVAGAILLTAIVATVLLLAGRRFLGPWRRAFRSAGIALGIAAVLAAIAFGLLLASL